MSGFVTAAALVRPSKSVLDLEAGSVLKRMKDKAFARAISRAMELVETTGSADDSYLNVAISDGERAVVSRFTDRELGRV